MKTLFCYHKNQFYKLKKQIEEDNCMLFSISYFFQPMNLKKLFEDQKYLIDISYLSSFVKSDESQSLRVEQLLSSFGENVEFICDKEYEKEILYTFRYIFDEASTFEIECDDVQIENNATKNEKDQTITKITDLNNDELEKFFEIFNARLYGHEKFKEEFKELVNSFRVFNMLGEHKILSLFLMGDSGVGKTEVARSIHKAFGSKTKLAKVNFGNYSSQDALNSLIGSPRGYIGSEAGELIIRINESDIGLILIDEFEKADNAVFNYFLDVLENGKIVNSQADEFDVNGYIIVFTSNMPKEDFKKRISPELRSRFDYKGVFNLLTNEDKTKFVHFRINEIIDKYKKFVSDSIPSRLHDSIAGKIDVSQYKNMRDLNKRIKDLFVEEIK